MGAQPSNFETLWYRNSFCIIPFAIIASVHPILAPCIGNDHDHNRNRKHRMVPRRMSHRVEVQFTETARQTDMTHHLWLDMKCTRSVETHKLRHVTFPVVILARGGSRCCRAPKVTTKAQAKRNHLKRPIHITDVPPQSNRLQCLGYIHYYQTDCSV